MNAYMIEKMNNIFISIGFTCKSSIFLSICSHPRYVFVDKITIICKFRKGMLCLCLDLKS